MKILLLTTHFNAGGITTYVRTLGESLLRSGHQVWIVSSGGDSLSLLEPVGVRHVELNLRTKSAIHPKLIFCFFSLKKFIELEKIEVIHAQTRVTQVLGFFLSICTRTKMVTTCHGFFRTSWFRKFFPCWGKVVIAISRPVAEHLNTDFGIDRNRIRLIYNGVDLNRFAMTRKRMCCEKPVIGTIARLSNVKGIDILIRAMSLVLERIPLASLLITGEGPEEASLRKMVQDLSLTRHVRFQGLTHQSHRVLHQLDVFVMPSLKEGLSLSVLEAQACGIPVVASGVGGLLDIVEDGRTGYLFEPKDPESLASAIIETLKNPHQTKTMTELARVRVEDCFSMEKMLKQTLEVYGYSRK